MHGHGDEPSTWPGTVKPEPAEKGDTMRTIQVYEPALCCNTGVCGLDVDQALLTFTADLEHLKGRRNCTTSRMILLASLRTTRFGRTCTWLARMVCR